MDSRKSRQMIVIVVVDLVVAFAVIVAIQPGSQVRTWWEIARVRKVEQSAVVYFEPSAHLATNPSGGWDVDALRPVEPVWRYQLVSLRLIPGCEIVLPNGDTITVSGSAESTSAVAFVKAAKAAMTVNAAVVDGGKTLVCRRVVVGKPPYEPIATDLRRGSRDGGAPLDGSSTVVGPAVLRRSGDKELLAVTVPAKQSEGTFTPRERQYAFLLPDTLFIAKSDRGIHAVSLTQANAIVHAQPAEFVEADLEQRGQGVFVVQLRVRAPEGGAPIMPAGPSGLLSR